MQTAHQNTTSPGWLEKLQRFFRLNPRPQVKLYHGFGNGKQVRIYGHVLKLSPFPRKKYRHGVLRNTLALLRLFMVKPLPGAEVEIEWKGKIFHTRADEEGFFRCEWEDEQPPEYGWREVRAAVKNNGRIIATGSGLVYVPEPAEFIFISDIDDTFLISHSKNLRKRLFVLFTNNARSRQPFEGVVKHYQLLQKWNTDLPANPFFYVSSSEWNLYDYLLEFTKVNELPEGIFLLNRLKGFSQLLKTGQNHHQTKFTRIVRIMEAFPDQRVVLLGDSSQQDPYIYEAVVKHFPKQVHAVYIRDVYHKSKVAVSGVLQQIETAGVPCCFFENSSEAILHSVKIGLIPAKEITEV